MKIEEGMGTKIAYYIMMIIDFIKGLFGDFMN